MARRVWVKPHTDGKGHRVRGYWRVTSGTKRKGNKRTAEVRAQVGQRHASHRPGPHRPDRVSAMHRNRPLSAEERRLRRVGIARTRRRISSGIPAKRRVTRTKRKR